MTTEINTSNSNTHVRFLIILIKYLTNHMNLSYNTGKTIMVIADVKSVTMAMNIL